MTSIQELRRIRRMQRSDSEFKQFGLDGVGTRIHKRFQVIGISPIYGCSCEKLIEEMDKLGPFGCIEQSKQLAIKMLESAKKWRVLKSIDSKDKNEIISEYFWKLLPIPPVSILEQLILEEARSVLNDLQRVRM